MLEVMHSKNIIYRDLRPENILIDHKGYLRLIDFGFAKVCEGKTYTVCGTPEYMAPEMILNQGYGREVDWWSFGCFLYELLVGITPFFENDPILIFKRAIKGDIKFPSNFPPAAKSIIKHLLEKDVSKRYGCLSKGVADVKGHRFYKDVDWNGISRQRGKPPYIPPLTNNDDMSLLNIIAEEEEDAPAINPEEDPFRDWIKRSK
jgi:serine/threonine protein kinase